MTVRPLLNRCTTITDLMQEFIEATPTAELLPLSAGVQDDESESEMGMSYEELSVFGILRRVEKLGPWSSYVRLLYQWKDRPGMNPRKIAEKVMHFFRFYSINRHKATIITPSIHLSAYSTLLQACKPRVLGR